MAAQDRVYCTSKTLTGFSLVVSGGPLCILLGIGKIKQLNIKNLTPSNAIFWIRAWYIWKPATHNLNKKLFTIGRNNWIWQSTVLTFIKILERCFLCCDKIFLASSMFILEEFTPESNTGKHPFNCMPAGVSFSYLWTVKPLCCIPPNIFGTVRAIDVSYYFNTICLPILFHCFVPFTGYWTPYAVWYYHSIDYTFYLQPFSGQYFCP